MEINQQDATNYKKDEYNLPLLSKFNLTESFIQELIKNCSSVTEIGLGSENFSLNILRGLSKSKSQNLRYIGIDEQKSPQIDELVLAKKFAEENHIQFTFWCANRNHIAIEPVDMLVLDSIQSDQLTHDLNEFSSNVNAYICIHNRVENVGEVVVDYLKNHSEWILLEKNTMNDGILVLKRINNFPAPYDSDETVNYYLKNKIILCTGPAFGHFNLLQTSVEIEMNLIPYKKIFVSTNDYSVMNITFNNNQPVCQYLENQGKQLDCTNCILTTLRNVANDPEVDDDDIIIFKHETVYVNDMGLVKKAIRKMITGYDMVVRSREVWGSTNSRGTDVFYTKVSAIRKLVRNQPLLTEFPTNASYCEQFFTKYIVFKVPKVYEIPYGHSNGGFTELGFYHIPSWAEGSNPWDRKNYKDIYNLDSLPRRK